MRLPLLQNKPFLFIVILGVLTIAGLVLLFDRDHRKLLTDESLSTISDSTSSVMREADHGPSLRIEDGPSGSRSAKKSSGAELQRKTGDSKDNVRTDASVQSKSGAAEAVVENSRLPSFFKEMGTLGKKAWSELTNMVFEDVKRTAALVEIGGSTAEGADSAARTQKEGDSSSGTRFVSWGCKNPCEPGKSSDEAIDQKEPPALTGFVSRAYDTHRNLLKAQAVRVKPDDPFGCGCYKVYLKDLLPPDMDPESFRGWLAVSKVTGTQKLESDAMWLNLDRPKDVTSGD